MSDDPNAVYSPDTEPGQVSEPVSVTPEYVTRKDLEEWGNKFTETITRSVQSLTDKQESRVQKDLKAWKEAMIAQGVHPTDAMINQKTLQLAEREADKVISRDAPAQAPSAIDPAVKAVNLRWAKLIAEHDFMLEQDDPEIGLLDFNDPPSTFQAKLEQAFAKKAARVGSASQTVPPVQTDPRARMPITNGAPASGTLEQLTRRLTEIQKADPAKLNPALSKEREQILKEMKALGK